MINSILATLLFVTELMFVSPTPNTLPSKIKWNADSSTISKLCNTYGGYVTKQRDTSDYRWCAEYIDKVYVCVKVIYLRNELQEFWLAIEATKDDDNRDFLRKQYYNTYFTWGADFITNDRGWATYRVDDVVTLMNIVESDSSTVLLYAWGNLKIK